MTSLKDLLSALALLAFVALPAFANDGVHGVLMVVKGDIKITSGKTKAVEPGKVGKKVFAGDTITAGPDSRAKIVMSDKNVLNISPDSKIVIEKYTNNGTEKNVELKVEYGKIRASVDQKYDGEKSKFNVKTPSAVAGVRGTDFLTGYNPSNKESKIVTFSGTVAVGQPGPGGAILNPVFVQPGQMTTASDGKPPEAPKAMPKEEMKQMQQETVAEAPAKKEGNSEIAKDKEAKDEKKDEKKEAKADEPKKDAKGDEPKKDEKKEARADEPKKDVKGDEPKKEEIKEVKKEEPRKEEKKEVKKDEPKRRDEARTDEPKKKEDGGNSRAPASDRGPSPERGPSMVDSRDLGPDVSRGVTSVDRGAAPISNFRPGTAPAFAPPPSNTFINDAIRNQRSKTSIVIERK